MQKGKIGVTSDNIFPIIKKFLYSEQEIFLRELISNATDAIQKLKIIASSDLIKGISEDLKIRVSINKKTQTLTVSDNGIGMTSDEVNRYLNEVAFSSAGEFLDKYKNAENAIIGHFGLGFYSAFMVAEKVEVITKSYKENAKAVKWSCEGNPEFTIEEAEREQHGTDVILYLSNDAKEYLEENKIEEILKRYCRFLPVEIVFGKEKEWKDGKYVDTDKERIINNPNPLWKRKPADVKDDDYKKFYQELYPFSEEPLFNIHLNIDYPFKLTGILYFPRIKNNLEIHRNKIQLYCNQVFVTDSVEGIVPDFMMLLHGVIDSPDIPLNVSRSYLQGDPNVKKLSAHITKKVADKLQELFKADRAAFENKWDDLKLFIRYGMISDEKFYEKATNFALLKNTDNKYFTAEEYEKLIKDNQTDKYKTIIYLYATDVQSQYTFIDAAKSKGYDVLLMDGQLDAHFINFLEQKLKNSRFIRVDADIIDNLIQKEDTQSEKISPEQKEELTPIFKSLLPQDASFDISFEGLSQDSMPLTITQSEYMRRMKDMAKLGGTGVSFYDKLPDNYTLVVNTNHQLIKTIFEEKNLKTGEKIHSINNELLPLKTELDKIETENKNKKEDEITQAEKDKINELNEKITSLKQKRNELLSEFGKNNTLLKQLVDIALLSNNMLKGEDLAKFVKRSVELIK